MMACISILLNKGPCVPPTLYWYPFLYLGNTQWTIPLHGKLSTSAMQNLITMVNSNAMCLNKCPSYNGLTNLSLDMPVHLKTVIQIKTLSWAGTGLKIGLISSLAPTYHHLKCLSIQITTYLLFLYKYHRLN